MPQDNIHLYENQQPDSDQEEILGRMPGWMIMHGSFLLVSIMIILLILSMFMRYNDTIFARTRITCNADSSATPVVTCTISAKDAGFVQPMQKVLISLDAYPAKTFGYFEGKVTKIHPFQSEKEVIVSVTLEKGLETTRNQKISQQPVLGGNADIIIESKSIFRRIFTFF